MAQKRSPRERVGSGDETREGHSKSRNGKWEMRNGKRGNGEMERHKL